MIKRALFTLILSSALGLALTASAQADIVSTLPEFNGPIDFDFNPADYPLASVPIGDFVFTISAGYSVIGGTISGTWGNNDVSLTSAPSDLYVDNGAIEVAECDDSLSGTAACDSGSSPTAWSYTFTANDLAKLATEIAGGSVDLGEIQNFAVSVQTGTTTLDLVLSPEPATIFAFCGGLAAIVLLKRLRKA